MAELNRDDPHEHYWLCKQDSQLMDFERVDVYCRDCGMPGEMNYETREVFYPAT